MNGILLDAQVAAQSTTSATIMMVVWIALIIGFMYFFMIRPQKNEQKKMNEMLSKLEIDDFVQTTGGFFGRVIDITDDTVIVEFGNNKNCRIPMLKTAISQVEKVNADK